MFTVYLYSYEVSALLHTVIALQHQAGRPAVSRFTDSALFRRPAAVTSLTCRRA